MGKGASAVVQAAPGEFSDDAAKVVEVSSKSNGMVSKASLEKELCWSSMRIESILDSLVSNGTIWVDSRANSEVQYWFPAVFQS